MQGTQALVLLFLDSLRRTCPGQALVDRMGREEGLGWSSIDPADRKPGSHI